MSREKILSFTKTYYDTHGVSPSIRVIADRVDGVDRKNFYEYFEDKDELLVALGIKEDVVKPKAAMEAKKKVSEKGGDYRITLNQAQSEKLIAIAYMEGKPISTVVNEILEEQRQVRQVMVEINGGILDSDIIDAILHPELIYDGFNVSEFAGAPWIKLQCNRCGDPCWFGEKFNYNEWIFKIMPIILRHLRPTCDDCLPKTRVYARIPAR